MTQSTLHRVTVALNDIAADLLFNGNSLKTQLQALADLEVVNDEACENLEAVRHNLDVSELLLRRAADLLAATWLDNAR